MGSSSASSSFTWVTFVVVGALQLITLAASDQFKIDGSVLDLDESNFESAISYLDYVFVDFYAPWCGYCKRLSPEVEGSESLVDEDHGSQISRFLEGYKEGRIVKKTFAGPSSIGGFDNDEAPPSRQAGPSSEATTGLVKETTKLDKED